MGKRLIPLLDRILVERFVPEAKTKGGIMIPEKAQAKVHSATVVAVGPGGRADVSSARPWLVQRVVRARHVPRSALGYQAKTLACLSR